MSKLVGIINEIHFLDFIVQAQGLTLQDTKEQNKYK